MSRIMALLAFILSSLALPAQADPAKRLEQAMTAMRKQDWDTAARLVKGDGPVARDIIEWHRLRAGLGNYAQIAGFLDRRADWPGLDWLRRKSEPAIATEGDSRIRAFFDATPPQTAEGELAYAAALIRQGQTGEAEASLVLAWRTLPMGRPVQDTYLSRHRALLAPHHAARLNRMLWDKHMESARRMLPLVSDGQRALAEARTALHNLAPGVDSRIAAVPAALRKHPGLVHARFVWRARKGRIDDAKALLLEQSQSAEMLGEPDKWSGRRRSLARDEMRDGDAKLAYRLASQHGLTGGSDFADLEWLSGYIALRKLDDPATALGHFQRHRAAIVSPISRGRAGYWIGRAYEAMGDADAASNSYADGASFQTSFYGLLAAERAGLPFDTSLANPPEPAPWRDAPFAASSVFEAGLRLLDAGELSLGERFLTHLAEVLNQREAAQLGAAALELGEPHLAVMIGKRVAQRGIVIPAAYYAVHPVGKLGLAMAPDMTLAIARRESEFDPVVVSGAGARGLMQVMPATARLVARDLGILGQHRAARLLSDWKYNARLGTAYLAGLAKTFDGNVVMMAAGYNAGPGRPTRWMQRYGDPRGGRMDIIDWIEHIPFRETRNYVMRVTESLPIYRARLGKDPLPIPFSKELTGSTLRAFAP